MPKIVRHRKNSGKAGTTRHQDGDARSRLAYSVTFASTSSVSNCSDSCQPR